MKQTDVVIIGAGMVGLTMALALVEKGFKVSVIDAKTIKENSGDQAYDLRVSAITPASAMLFKNLQVWDKIKQARYSPFQHMFVYDDKGSISFNADDTQRNELGWIIENSVIQTVLYEALKSKAQILMPANIEHINVNETGAEILIAGHEPIKCQLLIAADGANSWVRQHLNINLKSWQYEQNAIVANVRCSKGHQDTAWQHFLQTGPLAFLPLNEANLCSIVWSCETAVAEQLMQERDDSFALQLTQYLGEHVGQISLASQRISFPLMMRHIHQYVQPSLAFIGDAAHTIHPLAGQGANLGLYDVARLVDVLEAAKKKQQNIGSYAVLRKYERERKAHVSSMIMLMEGFKQLFSNDNRMLSMLRNQGLSTVNKLPPIKNKLIKQAMGFQSEMPSLMVLTRKEG